MGDVVHGLVALAAARHHLPGLRVHWVVESAFADLVRRSPMVEQVHEVAIRQWRKDLLRPGRLTRTLDEMRHAIGSLRSQSYDLVVDAQGLVKSAVLSRLTRLQGQGQRWGFDAQSARERPAAWAVDQAVRSPPAHHAIRRLLTLLGSAVGSPLVAELGGSHDGGALLQGPRDPGWPQPLAFDPGLVFQSQPHSKASMLAGAGLSQLQSAGYVLLVHGTSRAEKSWPVEHWQQLALQVVERGLVPVFPSGQRQDYARAQEMAHQVGGLALAPRSLAETGEWLASARAVVGVDSGLTHWAAAMGRPTLGLFLATPVSRFGLGWAPRAFSLEGRDCRPEQAMVQLEALMQLDANRTATRTAS